MTPTHIRKDIAPGTELFTMDWDLQDAIVVDRPNRFVVIADVDGRRIKCHIHDPGRLRELIFPGNRIMIREKLGAKTTHSVACALSGDEFVLLDSRTHPYIARRFLPSSSESEVSVGSRRIDFRCEDEYIEVKGCTLLDGKTAMFPDAPSVRAAEHVALLQDLKRKGYNSTIMFLVMRRDAGCFLPNYSTDPLFSANLESARKDGVNIIFQKMHLEGSSMVYDGNIKMCEKSS